MRIRRRGDEVRIRGFHMNPEKFTPEQKKLQEEFQRRQMIRRCLGLFAKNALAREKEAGDAYRKSFEPASTRKRAQRPQPKKRGGTA